MVGLYIGRSNVKKAKEYTKAVAIVLVATLSLQIFMFIHYKNEIITWMTSIKELQEMISKVYPLFLLNMIPDTFRGMLRGPIKGLNLNGELSRYHIVN